MAATDLVVGVVDATAETQSVVKSAYRNESNAFTLSLGGRRVRMAKANSDLSRVIISPKTSK